MTTQTDVKTPPLSFDDIWLNQPSLTQWDHYQLTSLNDARFDRKQPMLLPMSISLTRKGIERKFISTIDADLTKQIATMATSSGVNVGKIRDALVHFQNKAHQPSDSGSDTIGKLGSPEHATPLDLNINRPVLAVFHLADRNWAFDSETPFTLKKSSDGDKKAAQYVGVSANKRTLSVLFTNYIPDGEESFTVLYNLHVNVTQSRGPENYTTNIIIDPGTTSDDPLEGGPGGN